MPSDGVAGFWSYTHDDDAQDGDRLTRLANDLMAEFEMLSGQALTLFVDRSSLQWGDEWRVRIGEALDSTTFFIPIITPRFFGSDECRRELLRFGGQARSLGIEELIMPLLYVPVTDLQTESPDEAKALVARMQRHDVQELRFMDVGSAEYRRLVNQLARDLVEIVERVGDLPARTSSELASVAIGHEDSLPENDNGDDEPGLVDLVAKVEEDLPAWTETIQAFGPVMEEFASRSQSAAEKIERGDNEGKGFAYRIVVSRELAKELAEPAARMVELGETYASQLIEVDPGVRALIRLGTDSQPTGDDLATVCEFFQGIREMVHASRENSQMLQGLVETISANAKMSRDLRPVLRETRTGLRGVLDGQSLIDDWERQIDESAIECSESVVT